MASITFDHVTVRGDIPPGETVSRIILDNICLTLTEKRIGIIGANGSGKSTLVRLINGLSAPTEGRVSVDNQLVGKQGRKVRRRVGFIFAEAENQIVMPKVRDDVAFSLRRFRHIDREEKDKRVSEVLERFDLTDHAEASPHTLSGGQKQLLALASVVVIRPDIIIADEPTTLLDMRNRLRIRREFDKLEQQIIIVSHDFEFLSNCERIICLDNGRIIDDGPPHLVIPAYQQRILEEQDQDSREGKR